MCPKYVVITGQIITTEQDRANNFLEEFLSFKNNLDAMTTRPHIYVTYEHCRGKCKKKTESCRDNTVRENDCFHGSGACAFLVIFAAVASFALSVFAANASDLTPSQTLLSMKVVVAC